MAKKIAAAAFDLGASSGRLMLGEYDGEKIHMTEIYRFPNEPVRMGGRLYWDIFRLFGEMKNGLKKLSAAKINIQSIGIDTWGVDYGLLDKDGNLIGTPIAYRDIRTEHTLEQVSRTVPYEAIYQTTGIQYMPFNTLFQLIADRQTRPSALERADSFLMMPDLLAYYLTGVRRNEYTNMSTTQLLDARGRRLDRDLLQRLQIREELFCEMLQPGEPIGTLLPDIAEETGFNTNTVKCIAVGSHDTASAVAATPFENDRSAFLSCGTWSLLGVETGEPIINPDSYSANYTNEGGVEGTIRFLKNINGLYIMQELRKAYSKRYQDISFPELIREAEKHIGAAYIIDPDDPAFSAPPDMMEAIQKACGAEMEIGEMAMAVYSGLTREYAKNMDILEKLTGRTLDTIHMIGGGIQDTLLCRLTAEATGRTIITGPVEASAFGNVLLQLMGLGEIRTPAEGRTIIKQSTKQEIYERGTSCLRYS